MNNNQPLVSVVIPCYNHEQFVKDSIRSVIDQTYENIELIIIDDGSKDESVIKIQEMVKSCKQRFVRFEFRSRENKGLSETLNESLRWCQGKYYSAIASDDQMLDYKTKEQVEFLEKNKKCVAIFGGVYSIDKENRVVGKKLNRFRVYSFDEILLHKHHLPAPTQMINLKILKESDAFRNSIKIEDWYMLLKISKLGDVVYNRKLYSKYRQHDSNISHNIELMQAERIKVIDCFSEEKKYSEAKNRLELIKINEYILINKKISFKLLSKYVQSNKRFLLDFRFFKIILKYYKY